MKDYIKTVAMITILFVIGVVILIFITKDTGAGSEKKSREQTVLLNKIARTAEENVDKLERLDEEEYDCDYVIIDSTNNLLFSRAGNDTDIIDISVEKAIQNRYPYMFLTNGDRVWGTVIMLDDGMQDFRIFRNRFIIGAIICCLLILIASTLYGIYVNRSIIVPFKNLINDAYCRDISKAST